jgi:DNA-binding CsgD family transcriptional regulator
MPNRDPDQPDWDIPLGMAGLAAVAVVGGVAYTLAKAYKLTAMELRVLLGIVQVGGGPSVAEELGISETTVRSHLRHVYEKTGTNRQADLVKLVAAFESPWRDPGE